VEQLRSHQTGNQKREQYDPVKWIANDQRLERREKHPVKNQKRDNRQCHAEHASAPGTPGKNDKEIEQHHVRLVEPFAPGK